MRQPWMEEVVYHEGHQTSRDGHPDERYSQRVLSELEEAGFEFQDGQIIAPPLVDVEQTLPGGYTLAGAHHQAEDSRPIYDRRRSYRSKLHREFLNKRKHQQRDLKALIVGRDAGTGLGKSQLAIIIAKHVDPDWDAEEQATLDLDEYLAMYDNEDLGAGSAIVLDEVEVAAPARRSGSNQNIDAAHQWAAKRYKGLFTFATLPSPDMVDKHLRRLADLQITVVRRGLAKVQRLKIRDTPPYDHYVQNVCRIRWDAIDDDSDYQILNQKKEQKMEGYSISSDSEDDNLDEQDLEQAKKEKRNEMIREMADEMSQSEIAQILNISQSTVSRICRS